jgi:hypothetical protein
MSGTPQDLQKVNENLPLEKQLAIVLTWANQAGYVNVAAVVTRAIVELEAGRKLAS